MANPRNFSTRSPPSCKTFKETFSRVSVGPELRCKPVRPPRSVKVATSIDFSLMPGARFNVFTPQGLPKYRVGKRNTNWTHVTFGLIRSTSRCYKTLFSQGPFAWPNKPNSTPRFDSFSFLSPSYLVYTTTEFRYDKCGILRYNSKR